MKWAIIPALTLWALAASAGDDRQMLSLSGFATLGFVATDEADMRFTRVGVDRPGSERPDTGPDSVIGVQGNLRLGESSAAVLQFVSRENTDGSYQPRPTLAFLSHQFTPALAARVGRLRIPFFMQSDSININYAHPWVRPPEEVYGLSPFADLDGLDLLYRVRTGNTDIELHPFLGTSRISLYPDTKARLRRVAGVNLTMTRGDLSVHVGHAEAELEINWHDPFYTGLSPILRALGRNDIVSRMSGDDGVVRFSSAGFQWDDGQWLLIGEYARRRAQRYANSAHAWQFTVGHRFGAVTPYAVVARHSQDEAVIGAEQLNSLPPGFDELRAGLAGFNASRNLAQRSITAGVRWDVRDNTAVKAEFTRARTDTNAWGTFDPAGDAAAGRMGGRSINMLSLSVDVTF
ncbi:hypothetical protein [Thauera sinica]|uniref:Porin domain-containing protein n=1 Tax=Thauera sinica TaxID=2665146 RepID=A0ABW1ARW4_9RHOO|nr:hypothetical protein [Thauera sp. K11]ATE61067.1 hypothetical protein CCZ27_14965 [Thauera sp. K11]